MNSGRPDHNFLAAATIFSGATLLFVVEPLIAKKILPWFGGSAAVWTTCLLFFQIALLTGYIYAHALTSYVPARVQRVVHVTLLATSLVSLPIIPSETWKPSGSEDPLPQILGLLASTIGLPFVLLSSTNPLVQAWVTVGTGGASPPYRMFAVSNLGSLLALLSYPLLIEPRLSLNLQAIVWSALYGTFVVLSAATAWRYRAAGSTAAWPEPASAERLAPRRIALWLGLAAAPSALLLAMTNYMLQNIAAVPLFWVVPLALYLLSFVVAFGGLRWFVLPRWYVILGASVVALLAVMITHPGPIELGLLPLFAAVLFVCCTVCHCELALSRPAGRHLTSYYLLIAAGGASGGLLVAVVAPLFFNAPYELLFLIPATLAVVFAAASRHYEEWADRSRRKSLGTSAAVFTLAVTTTLAWIGYREFSNRLLLARDFYGPLTVFETESGGPETRARVLVNGKIIHGAEAVLPGRRAEPLTYYSRESGLGLAVKELGRDGQLRVGLIGLGVGTIAAYGRRGDVFRFYEIDPLVAKIARENFWYLKLSAARCDIIVGDGRLSLERQPPQNFDLLVIDAFVSDSIPMHLLTRQAFALYWHHLKPDGVLAVHVSNKFANLAPVVAAAAQGDRKQARLFSGKSKWVLVTSRPGFFDRPAFRNKRAIELPPGLREWTDDYSSLWSVLRL